MNSPLFVDTSAFAALFMADEDDHENVLTVFSDANTRRRPLVTTNAVIFETYTLILYRSRNGRKNALKFLDMLDGGSVTVVRLTATDEAKAIEIVKKHKDKKYSLCDAASFSLMKRLKIKEAVSLDDDFRSYGKFVVLPH